MPDDEPAYTAAIAELAPRRGGVAIDLGCGTGRVLPLLQRAFGPRGRRAALARRHNQPLRSDELFDPQVLARALAATGWTIDHIDDAEHRYLALAHRTK